MTDFASKILLYGASGHGKVIIECAESNAIKVNGIFDDNSQAEKLLNCPIVGSYDSKKYPELPLIISIGNNLIRKQVSQKVTHRPFTTIHTSAVISPSSLIGEGSVILHGSIVQASAKIGKHCIINTGATIDHDCAIEDFVHVSPQATLCGNVKIGEGTHIGAGATVIQGINIGKWATIGAGAVVVEDIPDYAIAVGCPAKIIKYQKQAV